DHLAIEGATSLGIVGAGVQADAQLRAIAAVRPIERVVVNDVDEAAANSFADRFGDRFEVRVGSVAEAAQCDVLSTVTPVRSPLVDRADLGEHTHVNAMGADAEGKQELDPAILEDAYLAIDDYEQCTHSGEINVPYADGRITDDDIDAELGDIVIGAVEGRTDDVGVTVFDSTGLAIQDIATARVVYEGAEAAGEGERIDLIGV
ncbi:MAG: ornithine cyclodeaminase family protein, partial [Halobacteriota archaeon]